MSCQRPLGFVDNCVESMSLFSRIFSVFVVTLLYGTGVLAQPALIVLLAVDQLRADRINATMPGGLGRLMREGYVFSEATLDHGLTSTCPGHIVMSTGVNPGRAGIPGNGYIDHETMANRYCVDDNNPSFQVFGTSELRSPNAITATSLGDWLKDSSPDSKVFAVSGKDRAAITLGGKEAGGVYWYNSLAQKFTSSGFYSSELPNYVQAFNGEDFFVDGFAGSFPEFWTHSPGSIRIDDYPGESEINSRKSGHPLNTGESSERADRVYFSPFLDIATAALAKRVIVEESLGRRGVTDMLAVSFSATDLVGHLYGPFSAEAEDALHILDDEIGLFLDMLDETLDGNYVLALSADHGVQPLPEWLAEKGELKCSVEGGRIDVETAAKWIHWYLYWKFTFPFGDPTELIGYSASGITVNAKYAQELGVSVEEIVAFLEEKVEGQAGVEQVWTHQELLVSENPFARLFRHSYVEGKSDHLITQFEETCLAFRPQGTSHGSAYLYDRRVPLIFFGKGVEQSTSVMKSHSLDIAPTLGAHLGLKMPSNLDGQALDVWK